MFGRKARQIANQAIMIATARKESHEHLSSIVDKNKKILALSKALQEAEQNGKDQGEMIRSLNAQITDLQRQIEDERKEVRRANQEVRRAEGAADAAIQAGGIISDQLHAAQDEIAFKEAMITALKADKEKLAEALRQARIQLDAYAADDERKPGKPGTAATRRPRLDFGQDVEALINNPIESQEATP